MMRRLKMMIRKQSTKKIKQITKTAKITNLQKNRSCAGYGGQILPATESTMNSIMHHFGSVKSL